LQNDKIRGRIRAFKYTDKETPVEGAVFGIYDKEGELVEKITSGADGYAVSGYHSYGKYTVVELSAPAGFVLNTSPFELEITENDHTYDLRVENERIPDVPDTGISGFPFRIAALAATSAGIAALLVTMKRRRRKTKSKAKRNPLRSHIKFEGDTPK